MGSTKSTYHKEQRFAFIFFLKILFQFQNLLKSADLKYQPRVLARLYLMTLYVIFPIHVNFPIKVCVLIHSVKKLSFMEKNIRLFYVTWSFFKRNIFYIVQACRSWLIFPFYHDVFLCFTFLYLSFINYMILFYLIFIG